MAEALWTYLLARDSSIYDLFVPGIDNFRADAASRVLITRGEFKLKEKFFQYLNQLWGPFTVDAFASQMNTQLRRFWCRDGDDRAAGNDALQQSWHGERLWLHPPYVLLPRVLDEIRRHKVEDATIIAPLWPTQGWFPALLTISTAVFHLGNVDHCNYAPTVSHQSKTITSTWQIGAFRVSHRNSNSRAIISQLSTELFQNGKITQATLP